MTNSEFQVTIEEWIFSRADEDIADYRWVILLLLPMGNKVPLLSFEKYEEAESAAKAMDFTIISEDE